MDVGCISTKNDTKRIVGVMFFIISSVVLAVDSEEPIPFD